MLTQTRILDVFFALHKPHRPAVRALMKQQKGVNAPGVGHARQFREEEEQRLREERQLAIVDALGSARTDETAERKEERVTECAKRVGRWKAKMTIRKWST